MKIEEAYDRLLAIGLADTPQPLLSFTDEPKLAGFQARIPEGRSWDGSPELVGQGLDPDPLTAKAKALAEAYERLGLFLPPSDPPRRARYGDLADQTDPADFFCYSSAQCKDRDFELRAIRDAELEWTPAREHGSGREVLLPSQLVYVNAARRDPLRIRRESISSGAAVGAAGTGEAFARGLFELIERDAFIGCWLSSESPPRIGGFQGEIAELIALLERYRLDCRVFNTRRDLEAPSVLALTLDRSGVGPAVTAGIAAAETYEDAVRSAVLESISYRRSLRFRLISGDLPPVATGSEIVSIESRIVYWSKPERLADLPAWTHAPPAVSMALLSAASCGLRDVLHRLSELGFRIFEADITDARVASAGFEAMRVVVPELHPLYISEASKALRSEHLGDIAAASNPLPHPFA